MNPSEVGRRSSGLYVYAVIEHGLEHDPDRKLEETPGSGSDLLWREHNGISVVYRAIDTASFRSELESRGQDAEWLETVLRRHNMVVEKLMSAGTVLPFRFGTVFETEEDLVRFLETHCSHLKNTLQSLKGRTEWGIKAFCESSRLTARAGNDEEIVSQRAALASLPAGRRYFFERKISGLIEKCVEKILNQVADHISSTIERAGGILNFKDLAQPSGGRVNVLNADVLLPADTDPVELLDSVPLGDELGLQIEISGPWPPYSFVGGIGVE